MSELGEKIIAARAALAQLELQAKKADWHERAALCASLGHDWVHMGGCNAGCENECCSCSVPVHQCSRCEDWDYGENAEAEATRAGCRVADL